MMESPIIITIQSQATLFQTEEYIQNYIDDFENIMLSSNYADSITGYPSIMNVESFVDFILVQELAKNVDAHRLSTYIYKDKDSIDNVLLLVQFGTSIMGLETVIMGKHGNQRIGY